MIGWSGHSVSESSFHFIIPINKWDKKKIFRGRCSRLSESPLAWGDLLQWVWPFALYQWHSRRFQGYQWERDYGSMGHDLHQPPSKENCSGRCFKEKVYGSLVIYGVTYEHSWFGRWGYGFCRGSFGGTEQDYNEAIEMLSSLELDVIVRDLSKTKCHEKIKQMIHYYRNLCKTRILSIGHLLRFMHSIKSSRAPKITVTSAAGADSSSSAFISRNSTKRTLPLKAFKAPKLEPELMAHVDQQVESSWVPSKDVDCDILFLYNNVLLGYPDSEAVNLAVQTLLDSRHFVKEWPSN
ncbi:PHD finger protein MALE MEIOCYTE DEATH 1 [Spatholobus suberectus]|nr:PHD finger protein MALE MEIOCYTE DEATH 1 [Spatholobus suberectus]